MMSRIAVAALVAILLAVLSTACTLVDRGACDGYYVGDVQRACTADGKVERTVLTSCSTPDGPVYTTTTTACSPDYHCVSTYYGPECVPTCATDAGDAGDAGECR